MSTAKGRRLVRVAPKVLRDLLTGGLDPYRSSGYTLPDDPTTHPWPDDVDVVGCWRDDDLHGAIIFVLASAAWTQIPVHQKPVEISPILESLRGGKEANL